MELAYVPTFGLFFMVNVGKYTMDGMGSMGHILSNGLVEPPPSKSWIQRDSDSRFLHGTRNRRSESQWGTRFGGKNQPCVQTL